MTSDFAVSRSPDDVANAIKSSKRLTVFLGAGASKSAGIPLACEIIASLAERLKGKEIRGADENQAPQKWLAKQPFYNKDNPYASVLDAAFPNRTERADYFESLVSGKSPTKAHIAIATLMDHGIVSYVLTTNFDRLMEYAIMRICRRTPCILLFDEIPTYLDIKSNRPKVLKLHGDYLFGNIRNLGYELYLVKESMSKKIELTARQGVLIVAGYSGGDDSVMEVLKELATQKDTFPGGVYWLTLCGHNTSNRVIKFLSAVSDRGSGVVEIDDSDTFFSELVEHLGLLSKPDVPRLELNAHLVPVENNHRERFVRDRTDELSVREFLELLRRSSFFSDFVKSEAALDYLLARFEESGDIPRNIGELVDRYIDLLVGSSVIKTSAVRNGPGHGSKAKRRVKELVHLELLGADEAEADIKDPCLRNYIGALRLFEDGIGHEEIGQMLLDNNAYGVLSFYVGLLEDATHVINSAIHHSVDSIVLYGRIRPWPRTFCRAAMLVGFASKVDKGTIERITDMLLLEFDTERWYPKVAISALANMGDSVIEYLIQYMLDSLQDTFSREDAALALGQIGTCKVVNRLAETAKGLTTRDTKFVVYALGLTGNPRAVPVLCDLASNVAITSDWVLQEALKGLSYEGDDIKAKADHKEPDPRPELSPEATLVKYVPDLEDRSVSTIYHKMFSENPSACLKVVNKDRCPPEATKLSRMGASLLAQNKPWEAEVLFTECLERYPMIECNYHNLALAYSRQGRPLAARRYYAMGLSLNPDYSDYYNDFAVTMMKLQNLGAARHLLVSALAYDINNYRPWLNLASVNMSESRILKSPDMRLVSDGNPSHPGLYTHTPPSEINFGAVVDFGKLRDAHICLRQVLKLNPSHPTAKLDLENLKLLTGEADDQGPVSNELIQVLHMGETIIPESVYIDDLPKEAYKAWQHSVEQMYQGDLMGAITAMEKVLQIYPWSDSVYHNLSILYANAGLLDNAIHYSESALKRWPWNYHLLLNYSTYLLRSNHPKEALTAAEKAVRVEHRNAASWFQLAQALKGNGKSDEAAAACMEAIRFATRWSTIEARAKDLLEEIEKRRNFASS